MMAELADERSQATQDLASAPETERGHDGPSPLLELIAAGTAVTEQRGNAGNVLGTGLRVAELVQLQGRDGTVRFRRGDLACKLAEFVDVELAERALTERERVLVEVEDTGEVWIVGVVQTRAPDVIRLSAREIELSAGSSLTLKSGRSGLRLSADGNVELVGSRISAASRGLLRLVGRALRLN
jgi:hypothetical protein